MDDTIEEALRRRHTSPPVRPPYIPLKRSWLWRVYQVISPDNINRRLDYFYSFVFALIWGR